MINHVRLSVPVVLAAILAACSDAGTPAPEGGAPAFTVDSVRDLGTVGMPPHVVGRDGGFSGIVDGKLVWTFGDTFYNPAATDGTNFRTATAALADPRSPLVTTEPLDAAGAPYPFLGFTPEEQRYNDSTGRPDERYALWPGSIVTGADGKGVSLYIKLKVHPGSLNFETIGTGLARFRRDTTFAVRDTALLFRTPEPALSMAIVVGDTLYAWGGKNDGTPYLPVVIARAPLALMDRRSAWTFWDGSGWNADYHAARSIMDFIGGDVSISYNAHLGRWLAVHSGFFASTIMMRTAPRPEGPWSAAAVAFEGAPAADGANDYAAKEQPHLATDGGRSVYVTYHQPLGFVSGKVHLVEVRFR